MANRTFLIGSQTSEPILLKEDTEVALAAGSNSIPPYWCSLFDASCILTNKVVLDDGRMEPYPYLVTSTVEARERLSSRRKIFDLLFPGSLNKVTGQWMNFVETLNLPFIPLDAAELWMMIGPDDVDSFLRNCLRAFDLPAVTQDLVNHAAWLEMLDVAQVDIRNLPTGNLVGHRLAGYSWGGPRSPWE